MSEFSAIQDRRRVARMRSQDEVTRVRELAGTWTRAAEISRATGSLTGPPAGGLPSAHPIAAADCQPAHGVAGSTGRVWQRELIDAAPRPCCAASFTPTEVACST